MRNPFTIIDIWASGSGDRQLAILLGIGSVFVAVVVLIVMGMLWYTVPLPGAG